MSCCCRQITISNKNWWPCQPISGLKLLKILFGFRFANFSEKGLIFTLKAYTYNTGCISARLRWNLFPFMIRRRAQSSFHAVVINRCSKLSLGRTAGITRRSSEMSPCYTTVILDISLWESPRPENRTMISIITGLRLIGMICTLA